MIIPGAAHALTTCVNRAACPLARLVERSAPAHVPPADELGEQRHRQARDQ
jgi:hypothetical protein